MRGFFSFTFYNGGSVYEFDVSTATFADVVVDSTSKNQTIGSCTIDGLKFEISENKGKQLPDTQNKLSVINLAGNVATDKNYVKFTTTGDAKVTVSFFHGTAGRHAKIITATDSTGQTGTEATTNDKAIKTTEFSLTGADTYYLGGDNGIYITKIVVEM